MFGEKRGQELSITTLILIVIGVVILVVVIIGVTGGWQNITDKLSNLGGGKSNVQTIVQACNIACSTGATYDYCSLNRTVNFGPGNKTSLTCDGLGKGNYGAGLGCESITCPTG